MQSTFSPILIVGSERSGTTLLSALLARHSQVAIPPETFFFSDIYFQGLWKRSIRSRLALVRAAMAGRVGEFGLETADLLKNFETHPSNMPDFFQSILETYAEKMGKKQCGEKCILHVFYVPLLRHWFPKARILGIVRDGRDVVLSMMRKPWHPNKLRAKCANWRMKSELLLNYEAQDPKAFKLLHYEDLVQNPETALRGIDSFLGIEFESSQLDPKIRSGVFLQREIGHKGKVDAAVDASRAFAWKTEAESPDLEIMNQMMGPCLQRLGYELPPSRLRSLPQAYEAVWGSLWIWAFTLLVRFRGLILYDKVRYMWRRRAMRRSGHLALGGL